jgi:hypothetical protein
VHFRSFQNNEVQASLSTHPIQSCFLYNLQVRAFLILVLILPIKANKTL